MFRLNKYKRGRIGGYVPFYKVGDKDWINCVEDVLAICSIAEKAPNTLVLGSRKLKENEPLRSKFGNTVTRFVSYISTGLKVHDTQTGLRAFRTDLIPVLRDISGERYAYERNVLLRCARDKIRILEHEIETIYIENNVQSHFDTVKDSVRIYKEILGVFLCRLISRHYINRT